MIKDMMLDGFVSGEKTITSFQLREVLGVPSQHSHWVKAAISRGRLVEGVDYVVGTLGSVDYRQQTQLTVKGNESKEVYHFTLDACETIALMSNSDVGHAVRMELKGYKKAYQQIMASQLEQAKLLNQTHGIGLSASDHAKASGYRTVEELQYLLDVRTGSSSLKSILEYQNVSCIYVGNRTYYNVVEAIEQFRVHKADSVQYGSVSFTHTLTGLNYTV